MDRVPDYPDDVTVYLVVNDFGKLGKAYVETDITEAVGGGEEPYILWRRPRERWPARNAVSRRRGTVLCMHSGKSGKCGEPAL
jgi:hypothetical protein